MSEVKRITFNDTMFRLIIFSCLFLATFAESDSQTDTDITVVPHQVSVQYENKHRCGGSIIGRKYILTAAHCVQRKDPTLLSIRAGSNYHNEGGQVVDVNKVISHPNYNDMLINNDAAILVLIEPLNIGEGVQIAALANIEPKEGDMALISGWGSIEGGNLTNLLQSVSLPVVSKTVCNKMYEGNDTITDQMFCAGYLNGEKDSCHRDSGGPAVVNGKLAGIVSWGGDCSDEKYPGVYTNIASMLTWISAEIQE